MKKVILYIAITLDGYIADKNNNVDWISGEDANNTDMSSYLNFIEKIDTAILGWKTYNQIITTLSPNDWPYKNLTSYIITNRNIENKENIIFTNRNLKELILELKSKNNKDIWICGGASIANQLIKENLIDRYIITIIPKILGSGISLFENTIPNYNLKLISNTNQNGMVELVYDRI